MIDLFEILRIFSISFYFFVNFLYLFVLSVFISIYEISIYESFNRMKNRFMNNVVRELISHRLSFVTYDSRENFRDNLYILSRTIEIAFF